MINEVNVQTGETVTRDWTEKELSDMAAAREWQAKLEAERPYTEKRAEEYPNIGDQLDEIMKWLATEGEFSIPAKLKSMAGKCMAVKSKYPKPQE